MLTPTQGEVSMADEAIWLLFQSRGRNQILSWSGPYCKCHAYWCLCLSWSLWKKNVLSRFEFDCIFCSCIEMSEIVSAAKASRPALFALMKASVEARMHLSVLTKWASQQMSKLANSYIGLLPMYLGWPSPDSTCSAQMKIIASGVGVCCIPCNKQHCRLACSL
jgi:hypothetical protein